MRMRLSWIVLAALVGPTSMVAAQGPEDWTTAVFPERNHNFGTVARGSKVRHSFPVVNSTREIIRIVSYKPLCGCTDVRLGAREIPPGSQTVVEAVVDTTNFLGLKDTGLILNIDRPSTTSVHLGLTCFIEGELTLAPGQVDFGVVNRSTAPEVELTLTYAGKRPDWLISEASTISEHITATLNEQGRSAGGSVVYRLAVKLNPTAPVGHFKDEITLRTNDPNIKTVPISVAAVVQSNVTVTPSVINLGAIRAGSSVQRTFIVRSAQPFKVVAADSRSADLTLGPIADQPRALHSLNFTFKSPTTPGAFNTSIEIQSDLKDEPPTRLLVFATVVP